MKMLHQGNIRFKVTRFVILTLLSVQSLVWAGMLGEQTEISWASRRDMTDQQFNHYFKEYSKKGYLITDIEGYHTGRGLRYSMIWQKNSDKRKWKEHRNISSKAFNDYWTKYSKQGMRPIEIETYKIRNVQYWAGIWVENKEKIQWKSFRNQDAKTFKTNHANLYKSGYSLVNIEADRFGNKVTYTGVYYKLKQKYLASFDLTRAKYQAEVNRLSKQYRMVDYESYETPSGRRYATIWKARGNKKQIVQTQLSEVAFRNAWLEYRDDGYRLIDFECYKFNGRQVYSGIWLEHNSRLRDPRVARINKALKEIKAAQPNIPGLSLVIIEKGRTIYRGGIGLSDVSKGKKAHAENVYPLASVSKVIGGTLATRLEELGKINLSKKTSDYIRRIKNKDGETVNLPLRHRLHTLEDLLRHRAGVAHYGTTPAIANTTNNYASNRLALIDIWDTNTITRDRDGVAFKYGSSVSYSTPAFTFLGAAMEEKTGKSLKQLLTTHITRPHRLSSIKIMFQNGALVVDAERVTSYRIRQGRIVTTTLSNNSWKTFGGGLESNAMDLARFGWLVMNNKIVSKKTKDNRLWKPVSGTTGYGLSWLLSRDSKRRATREHGGSWTGTQTHLRCYPNEGVVIVLLANSSELTTNRSIKSEVHRIADALFSK